MSKQWDDAFIQSVIAATPSRITTVDDTPTITYDSIMDTMRALDHAQRRRQRELATPLTVVCRPEDEDRVRDYVEQARTAVARRYGYDHPIRRVEVRVSTVSVAAIPAGQMIVIDPLGPITSLTEGLDR